MKKSAISTPASRRTAVTFSLTMVWAVVILACGFASADAKTVQPNPGVAGSWRLIGTTHADHSVDHDTIVVQGPFDNFRRIKFKVTDAPLNMLRMVVTYDNGAPDPINIRQNIPQGGESRAIDLRGVGKRSIRKIDFWYETKGFLKGKADVTVFGMK
jgi:hypothetical protein